MNMVTEDYVSFETAKLLKEKGFDEPIEMLIREDGTRYHADTNSVSRKRHIVLRNSEINMYSTDLSCPTLQMTMKWLREVHSCYINTYWEFKNYNENGNPVFKDIIWSYNISIPKYNSARKGDGDYFDIDSEKEDYTTYEEVCEAAIKYCLENLI